MENIIRTLCRHLVFMLVTFTFLFIVCLTFTAPINFTTWDLDGRIIFSLMAHVGALFLHAYFLDRYGN